MKLSASMLHAAGFRVFDRLLEKLRDSAQLVLAHAVVGKRISDHVARPTEGLAGELRIGSRHNFHELAKSGRHALGEFPPVGTTRRVGLLHWSDPVWVEEPTEHITPDSLTQSGVAA